MAAEPGLKPIRRSTRLEREIPVLVTSLDMRNTYCEECKTVAINAHGCGVITGEELKVGSPVTIDLLEPERSARARVVVVVALSQEPASFLTGLEFDTPGNFWGLEDAPADWNLAP